MDGDGDSTMKLPDIKIGIFDMKRE